MFIHIADAEDLLLLISGSGNSKNIIKLAEVAKEKSVKTLALTGFDGGELSKFADLEIRVDSFDMQIVENMHLAILHSILKV
jgi:D-sedoheptulose 7-phosphate isomerase